MLTDFIELGRSVRAVRQSAVSFADSVGDPDILSDLMDILSEEIGRLDSLTDVSVEGETFTGKANQRIGLGRSQVYSFTLSADNISYQMLNASEMAEFADSDEGWQEIIEFAATKAKAKGKRADMVLKCKPGNTQCGGKCQSGQKRCNTPPSEAQKAAIKAAAKKAKAATKKTAAKSKPTEPVEEKPKDAIASKPKATQDAIAPRTSERATTEEDRRRYREQAPDAFGSAKLERWIAEAKKKHPTPPPHPEEYAALKWYTDDGFRGMNSYLRGQEKLKGKQKEDRDREISMAVAGLEAMPVYQGTVYRGTNFSGSEAKKYLKQYKVGAEVTEPAFASTSKAGLHEDFEGQVNFVIKSKTGRSIAEASNVPSEDEVLFPPATRFKVLEQESYAGVTTVYMEEV